MNFACYTRLNPLQGLPQSPLLYIDDIKTIRAIKRILKVLMHFVSLNFTSVIEKIYRRKIYPEAGFLGGHRPTLYVDFSVHSFVPLLLRPQKLLKLYIHYP